MTRLLRWLLPGWARHEDALLRYQLARRVHGRSVAWQVGLWLLALALAALVMELAFPAEGNLAARIWRGSRYPLLALQTSVLWVAFLWGAAAVSGQRSRKTWDSLRATEDGVALALRLRCLGILFRLRAPIAAILLLRLVFCAGMIIKLAAYRGHHAAMLGMQATPPVAEAWQVVALVAAFQAALMLLPLTALGLMTALGMALAVAIRERVFAGMAQILALTAQLILVAADVTSVIHAFELPVEARWAWQAVWSAFGDWGLSLANLREIGEMWARLPQGAWMSVALILLALLQACAADGMMWLAGRIAERRG